MRLSERIKKSAFSPFLTMFSKAFFLRVLNPLPNNKILDWSKLQAYTDDKMNVTEKVKYVLGRAENIVGNGENAGYQHFLHNVFKGLLYGGLLEVVIVW